MAEITNVDILDEAKECFLVYAEEVLTDRAVPNAEDGLLSVQRKILWTMEDYLKMNSKSKTKKSNSIVGSTLATSYFHGDASCYGALCKMSQEYLMRYPLITGQGSLGTQENNDMVSSSRYTEAKPSIYADLMMIDFNKEVVPLKETYNSEYMEPVILPSLFPNSICNGRQGIGVSLAHCSAPHNLTEVCDAAISTIQNGRLAIDDLLAIMPGPDFPLGGKVINSKDVRSAFATGKSSVSLKIQGDYELDGQKIIFTTIPYRTYRNKIKEQIEKNIDTFAELLDDFDDESNVGQNRLVFYVKNGVSISKALNTLFLLTDLQTTLSYNMNYIVNGTPRLCSMPELLEIYVNHQEQVLIKGTEFDKAKAVARAHTLRGLIAAVDKIDQVIELIKASPSRAEAKTALIDFLAIDEVQAQAILDMKLGKLTRVDKEELVKELEDREAFISDCDDILQNKEIRNKLLIEKVTWLRNTYGDARRTQLLNIEAPKKEKEPVVVEPEDCVVIVTGKNTVKRLDPKSFKPQRRNTTGTKNSDMVVYSQQTNTQDYLMVFTTKGKMYRILVDNIPEGGASSAGTPISSLIDFDKNEFPITFTTLNRDTTKTNLLFVTKNGLTKRVPISEYDKMKRTGVSTINLKEGDSLAVVTLINEEEIILITKQSMSIRFKSTDLPISSRIAQGVKGIKLSDGDEVIAALPISAPDQTVVIVNGEGMGKRVELKDFPLQGRAGKGVQCGKGEVAGAAIINQKQSVMINGDKSSIVISAIDIPVLSRTGLGNAMIKNNMKITSVSAI